MEAGKITLNGMEYDCIMISRYESVNIPELLTKMYFVKGIGLVKFFEYSSNGEINAEATLIDCTLK